MRTKEQIEAEIAALEPACKGFDTETQTDDTCIAVGAHDALRWVLGLAETPISENYDGGALEYKSPGDRQRFGE